MDLNFKKTDSAETPKTSKESTEIDANTTTNDANGLEYISQRDKHGRIPTGRIIQGHQASYKILDQLGSGGFGEVYKVEADSPADKFQQRLFALKCEYNDYSERGRMTCEIAVFNSLKKVKRANRIHFCELYDNGTSDYFNWMVITLTGPSLEYISKRILGQLFSSSTILQIALQSLEAIRDLHNIGFLHRDIKPQNFSVCLPPDEKIITLLDFGICRRFMDHNGVLRPPREKVKFLGTVRYASRACHLNREQYRQDDFEQWIYMIYELYNPLNLHWRTLKDLSDILLAKNDFFIRRGSSCRRCPEEFKMIIGYIDGLTYSDHIDHLYMSTYIKLAATNHRINLGAQLDWVDLMRHPARYKKSKGKKNNSKSIDDSPKDIQRDALTPTKPAAQQGQSAVKVNKVKAHSVKPSQSARMDIVPSHPRVPNHHDSIKLNVREGADMRQKKRSNANKDQGKSRERKNVKPAGTRVKSSTKFK